MVWPGLDMITKWFSFILVSSPLDCCVNSSNLLSQQQVWWKLGASPKSLLSGFQQHITCDFCLGKPVYLIEDQIFLFLVRVKVGRFTVDLAVAFRVSASTVSRTVITWTNFLYFTLGRLPVWPTRAQIQRHMPTCFQETYPNVRVILDCTEIFLETSSSLVLQSEVFSSYKSHTT